MDNAKTLYIGDGVYVNVDRGQFHPVTIMTGHHDPDRADNVIYFELDVLKSLLTHITAQKS